MIFLQGLICFLYITSNPDNMKPQLEDYYDAAAAAYLKQCKKLSLVPLEPVYLESTISTQFLNLWSKTRLLCKYDHIKGRIDV